MPNANKRGLSRVFTIENRAAPNNAPTYHNWAAAGAISWGQGDITDIEAPSQTTRDAFDRIGEVRGAADRVSMPITFVDQLGASEILHLVRLGCPFDVLVVAGLCTDPKDIDGGWSTGKVRVFENALISDYSTTEIGALSQEDRDKIDEEIEISARDYYEIVPISYAERAAATVGQEVIAIVVCDTPECGDCTDPGDGCQKVFAVAAPAGSSPGVLPEVIWSDDGFTTSADTDIDTLAIGEDPSDAECVGDNLVVVSLASESIHWANKEDIIDGDEVWAEVTSGFVAGNGPNAITSAGPQDTWICGENGYIYKTSDPTNSVTVQDAGVATTEDLHDIYAFDAENVVAVGENNTVVHTTNGGSTWASVTGPDAVGLPTFNCVFMRSASEWWVGTNGGRMYYTRNSGDNWTEKAFPGSGTGQVHDIVFASDTVGFMTHATAANVGRILRTITGGYTWFVEPIGSGVVPAADKFNALAVCQKQVNIVYAAGLADNAADGIIVKGS